MHYIHYICNMLMFSVSKFILLKGMLAMKFSPHSIVLKETYEAIRCKLTTFISLEELAGFRKLVFN